jgi:mono/diheme cytochrome c family protein
MRWRALFSLLALLWFLVLIAIGCDWGPFAPSSLPPALSLSPRPVVPKWIKSERLPPRAVAGAKLFAVAGCTACHTYDGSGSSNLGAPDLTAIGRRNLGIAFEIRHLKCPACANPGSPMPPFASLGPKRLSQLAIFLEASKGTR